MNFHRTSAGSASPPEELGAECSSYLTTVDRLEAGAWHDILMQFQDASLYQTWAVGVARWGKDSLDHIVFRRDGEIVGAAQVSVKKIPLLGTGIAYVPWGPVFRRDEDPDLREYRCILRKLRDHYVSKCGLSLVVMPSAHPRYERPEPALAAEGFEVLPDRAKYKSLIMDLTVPQDDLRSGLAQSWRRNLKRAGKNEFVMREVADGSALEQFFSVYDQMMEFKKFKDASLIGLFREFQQRLPDHQKLRIIICELSGEPMAAAALWVANGSAVRQFAATSPEGRATGAAYWLDWSIVEKLKSEGCMDYDLCGIDRDNNPGVYRYKAGLAGANTKIIEFPGQFGAWEGSLSKILLAGGLALRDMQKRLSGRRARSGKY